MSDVGSEGFSICRILAQQTTVIADFTLRVVL
jgi:hypothetical protein